jgi:transcriptional regulator with XRE-family HTH domain
MGRGREAMSEGFPWEDAGRWMRELREKCGLSPSDVDQETEKIKVITNVEDFHVSRQSVTDIENGKYRPSISRLRVLAKVYKQEASEIASWYGMLFAPLLTDADPNRIVGEWREVEQVLLEVAWKYRSTATRVLTGEDASVIPAGWFKVLGISNSCVAVTGTKDRRMGKFLPPRCLTVADRDQTIVELGPWASPALRPIYSSLAEEGHVSSWIDREGGKLKLHFSHPSAEGAATSRNPSGKIDIIGRIVRAWQLPRADSPDKDNSAAGDRGSKERP